MSIQQLLGTNTSSVPGIIIDPFKKDKIKQIWMYARIDNDNFIWEGWIEFKNGNSSGKQHTVPTRDFNDMIAQVQAIIKSIP